EVQRIATDVTHWPQVQAVVVDAAANLSEVQALTLAAANGSLDGSFRLAHGFYRTPPLRWNATAAVLTDALAMLPSVGAVSVLRLWDQDASGADVGVTHKITFWGATGDVAALMVDATGLFGLNVSTSVSELRKGVPCAVQEVVVEGAVGGTFMLALDGVATAPIAWNAPAAAVETTLEALPACGDVMVVAVPAAMTGSSVLASHGASGAWMVHFLGRGGTVPVLEADAEGLLPLPQHAVAGARRLPPDPASVRVTEVRRGQGVSLSGNFTLGLGNASAVLAVNATAAAVEMALRNLGSDLANITVSESATAAAFNGGAAWDVTFPLGFPPASRLWGNVSSSSAAGTSPFVRVAETVAGTRSEVQLVTASGPVNATATFFLDLGGAQTAPLAFNATSAQVAAELERLEGAGAVNVTCAARSDGGYEWLVTFVEPATTARPLPLLWAGGVDVTGSSMTTYGGGGSVNVTRVQAGDLAPLSGLMRIAYGGSFNSTDSSATANAASVAVVPFDVSAKEMVAALETLPGVGAVEVTRVSLSNGGAGAYEWTVTFTELAVDAAAFSIDASALMSNGDVTATVETLRNGTGACCVGGNFTLEFSNVTTASLGTSSAELPAVTAVLAAIVDEDAYGPVSVSFAPRVSGGGEWHVTFEDVVRGDAPLLIVDGSNLTRAEGVVDELAASARSTVHRVAVRSLSTLEGGNFSLALGSLVTRPLPFDADVETLRAAIAEDLLQNGGNDGGDGIGGGGWFGYGSYAPHVVAVAESPHGFSWAGSYRAWDVALDVPGGTDGLLACTGYGLKAAYTDEAACTVTTVQNATSEALSGGFRLMFGDEATELLPHDVDADAMQDALEVLSGVAVANVTKAALPAGAGSRWQVTFWGADSSGGGQPLLGANISALSGTDAAVVVSQAVTGSRWGGDFALGLAGGAIDESTAAIPYDAGAELVRQRLRDLPGIDDVAVERFRSDWGYIWRVTFCGHGVVGDRMLLEVRSNRLAGAAARIEVEALQNGTDALGGTFGLSFGGAATDRIAWDAAAADVEAALEALPTVGGVTVWQTVAAASSSAAWLVEFTTLGDPANLGDLPLLDADGDLLTGTNAAVTVTEEQAGCCAVEVTLNGRDFSAGGPAFGFQDFAVVTAVAPWNGPTTGGTPLRLAGVGFATGTTLFCTFDGSREALAVWETATAVTCVSPPVPTAGRVALAVRWYDRDSGAAYASRTLASFSYHEPVVLATLRPSRGGNGGGAEVTVRVGSGVFASAEDVFGGGSTVSRTYNGTALYRDDRAATATFFCRLPGLDDFFSRTDRGWLGVDWGAEALVSLSGNGGVDITAPLAFTYTPLPVVDAVFPAIGAATGGTRVTLSGRNFLARDRFNDLQCRFGPPIAPGVMNDDSNGTAVVVAAEYAGPQHVVCLAPPYVNVASVQTVTVAASVVTYEIQAVELRRATAAVSALANDGGSSAGIGSFTLQLDGFKTAPLLGNATADEVAAAVAELPSGGAVNITRSTWMEGSDGGSTAAAVIGGLTWEVTQWEVRFETRGGDVPEMTAAAAPGDATARRGLVKVTVRTVQDGGTGGIVPEVQRLRTNRPARLAEQQTVFISATTTPAYEIQQVTLAAAAEISGTFILTYGGSATVEVEASASAATVEAAIQALGRSVVGTVEVSRGRTGVRGYVWTVTFMALDGDRPQLKAIDVTLAGAHVLEVETLADGVAAVDGNFSLALGAYSTGPLPLDATAAELAEALSALLPAAGSGGSGWNGASGRSFNVTFTAAAGNVPELVANVTGLSGGGAAGAAATVDTVRNGTDRISGTFALMLGVNATDALPYNASAGAIMNAVNELWSWGGLVLVSRSPLAVAGDETNANDDVFEWLITFPPELGDVPELRVFNEEITGAPEAAAALETLANGSYVPLGGGFSLCFGSEKTAKLPFNATAAEVAGALEALNGIGRVDVTRAAYWSRGRTGVSWAVSFLPGGAPSHAGAVDILTVNATDLSGWLPVGRVRQTVAGYGPDVAVAVSVNGGAEFGEVTALFRTHPPFALTAADPVAGPSSGGTRVVVAAAAAEAESFAFDPSNPLVSCRFGARVVPATVLDSVMVACDAPATTLDGGVVTLAVSNNGADFIGGDNFTFTYYATSGPTRVSPAGGPLWGGTVVTIAGPDIAPWESGFGLGSNNGTALALGHGWMSCLAPAVDVPVAVAVEVSLNGGADFTSYGAQYAYWEAPRAVSVEPPWGPVAGGTAVEVTGGPFRDGPAGTLRCRFGSAEATALWRSPRAVSCRVPPLSDVVEVQAVTVSALAFAPAVLTVATSGAPDAPEVRRISTWSATAVASEVQRVALVWDDVDEVQRVTVTQDLLAPVVYVVRTTVAAALPAVQELRLEAAGAKREQQAVVVRDGASAAAAGNFALSVDGATTAALAPNASAAEVEAALEALSGLVDVEVTRFGYGDGGSLWTVVFVDPAVDVDLMAIDAAGLSGTDLDARVIRDVHAEAVTGVFNLYYPG
ncbi:unnamed protein product, partial [Phaeothamnion confervicola]